MWWQTYKKFVYFFFTPTKCINNQHKIFNKPFNVDPQDKKDWSSNNNSVRLAPETLTYWSKDDEV